MVFEYFFTFVSVLIYTDVEVESQSFAPEWVYSNQCDKKDTMHLCVRVYACVVCMRYYLSCSVRFKLNLATVMISKYCKRKKNVNEPWDE